MLRTGAFDEVGPGPQVVSINDAGEFYIASPWAEARVRHFDGDGEDSLLDRLFGFDDDD